MSSSKRECASCQFFQNAHLAGNGWCTHPKRQLASDVRILVRARELACRNSWGDDLWADKELHATTSPLPPSSRSGMIYVNRQADDEVTSVVDTTTRGSAVPSGNRSGGSDDQVTHTSIRAELPGRSARNVHDPNIPANDDQADRARSIVRGSRDAILRARERHAQRRTPARSLIDPEPSIPSSGDDQGPTSRHREEQDIVVQEEHVRPVAGKPFGRVDTPPVPREEVQAKGIGLSPAVGPDARFDSVPEVKADIELPRLRQFLHGSAATTPADPTGTPLPDVSQSSYDLVLRRAREIKAAGMAEPLSHHPAPARQAPPPVQAVHQGPPPPNDIPDAHPAPPHPPRNRPQVVWDLDPDGLNVAFHRVRQAIDQPLPMRLEQPGSRSGTASNPDATPPVVEATNTSELPVEDIDDAYLVEEDDVDAPYLESAREHFRSVRQESPRGSWWRSLNFGLRRRVSLDSAFGHGHAPQTRPANESSYDAEGGWDHDRIEAKLEPVDEWGGYDEYPDAWDDDGPAVIAEEGRAYAGDAIEEPGLATSEESWLEDEVEFPEPQPAEWHETRAALRASVHSNHEPDDLVLSPVPLTETRTVNPAQTREPAGPPRPAPDREPQPFYAIDRPDGMNAFRAALFGSDTTDEPSMDTAAVPSPTSGREWVGSELAKGSANEPMWSRPVGHERSRTAPARRLESETRFDITRAIPDQDELVRTYEVASGVPKCCRTCRSFRPSEHRDRGWCMNSDAFTHRQMVNADMLSCHSSIGDWWLAADQSWFPPEDVIHPETPRTDRLLAQRDPQHEPSPQDGRRVRTRKAV